ncbi:MAG: hypothetical protein R3E83_09015 [Burkholderiaceae bacterium]
MKTCKLTHRTSGAVTASRIAIAAGLGSLALAGTASAADPVLEWNKQAVRLTVAATKSPPLGNHILAMTQTAVYLAGNAITRRYPAGAHAVDGTASASLEAGVASASYRMLVHLLPRHAQPIEAAYSAAIRSLGDSQAVRDGLGIGERAFEATLRWRQSLAVPPAKPYRPATAPGVYVPTQRLAGVGWGDRATWILSSSSEQTAGTAGARQCHLGQGLQRGAHRGCQSVGSTHGRAIGDRALLGAGPANDLLPGLVVDRGDAGARCHEQCEAAGHRGAGNG